MIKSIHAFLRYSARTHQGNQLWLPVCLTLFMMLIIGLFRKYLNPIDVSSAFTGVVLPLLGGIMAAYSTLDDPCLELHFSTPGTALEWLFSRFSFILLSVAICSLGYQFFIHTIGLDMSSYGSIWQRQLNWLIPGLGLISLGFFSAYLAAQSHTGAMMVGLVWILQVIAREWFLTTPGANLFFIFTGSLYPTAPTILASQIVIWICSCLLLGMSWYTLRIQERYI